MIKVLIVEDSPVARKFLTYVLTSDPAIQVVGTANNGVEALETLRRNRPDVITMDIHMPMMDGFEATRRIMETFPAPIVIVSGSSGGKEVASTFRALEAGALAVVRRPPGINHQEFEAASRELIQTVKLMSEVKVVKRFPPASKVRLAAPLPIASPLKGAGGIRAIAIGASTGGPPVLKEIISGLPQDFPFPVFIVQHIAQGFAQGFVDWLSGASGFPVSVALHGERAAPGHCYVAPNGFHLGVGNGLSIVLSDGAPENGMRPSVSYLFRSVAQALGPAEVGVLLTGMGRDGAEELKAMKEKGAITIAQDEDSSVVHSMPGEAIKLGAATYVLPPEGIAAMLAALVKTRNGGC
ncbi:MAG: chemotaxis-specific protein-glutamate methyltransferase CheB [Candidatus Aminicenantes bacterium]|nr:chemotaxis-specific protein-glutamate methyltransferase CheB [Candidatus Aminicenantes bacterium]